MAAVTTVAVTGVTVLAVTGAADTDTHRPALHGL